MPIIIDKIINGVTNVVASLIFLAVAEITETIDIITSVVDTKIKNNVTYVLKSNVIDVSDCISFGSDKITPIKLDILLKTDQILNEKILPNAICLLLVGVESKVAIVPRSLSPAIDSGPTAKAPWNKNVMINIGSIIATKLNDKSFLENVCSRILY